MSNYQWPYSFKGISEYRIGIRMIVTNNIFMVINYCNVADRRVGFCFRQLVAGRCTSRTDGLMSVTRADCCCTMGAAWGPHCEICPSSTSDDYQDLCLESGYSVDGHGKEFCNTLTMIF